MIRKLFSLATLFILVLSVQAQDLRQSKALQPNKYTHDFGIIKQVDGEVFYTFTVKNISDRIVMINSANPECSCTEPVWTQEGIPVGANGDIKVGYKADHYPGEFNKKITVYTNLDTFELRITGKVIPKPLSDVEKEYPVSIGKIRMKDDAFMMNTIYDNAIKTKEFVIYNDSSKAIKGLKFENVPAHVMIVVPEIIEPKSHSKITVSFDPMKWNDYGHTIDYVSVKVGTVKKEMSVIANVSPFIPVYTQAELTNAPRLKMDSLNNYNFGVIRTDSLYTKKIALQNIGNSDLTILKIKPACACITVDINDKIVIKPNQTKVVTLSFDTKDRTGNTKKSIYFYSSDPTDPAHVLKISADIK